MARVIESEGLGSSTRGSNECKTIFDIATKDLFRKNGFRITGLTVDATPRDVAKHVERLKVLAELGQDPHPTSAFPLRPSPTVDEIRDAIQRLKDPEKRLIDEFFWFWPQSFGESRPDAAIDALQKGDLQAAADMWMSKRKHPEEGIVATHNLALICHIKALEWENYALRHEVDAKRRAKVTEYWRTAFYRWNRILTNEEFWGKVVTRIRQLNDPSITTGFARRMRAAVPAALIKINAELAVTFAESSKTELAREHIELMDGIKQAAAEVSEIAELVLSPARRRLQEHVGNAKNDGAKNPSEAIGAARELLNHTRDTLFLFDLFISKSPQLRSEAFDEVAETCNRLQVTCHKATGDNETCLEFLKVVLPFAASQELREQIEKNIQTLKENIEGTDRDKRFYGNLRPISLAPALSTFNGIGFTLFGSTDVDSTNGSYLTTYYFCFVFIPIFPVCRYRVIREGDAYRFLGKASLRPGDKWHLMIAIGLVILFMITVISADNASQSSSSYSRRSPSSSTSRPSTATSSVYPPNAAMRAADDRLTKNSQSHGNSSASNAADKLQSSDASDGDTKETQLRALATEKNEIESERKTVHVLEDQVEELGSQIERDRILIDRTNQHQIDWFNGKVRRYNTLVERARTAEAALNRKVDNYNAKLDGYASPSSAAQRPSVSASNFNSYRVPSPASAPVSTSVSAPPPPANETLPIGTVNISGNDTLNVRADASADSAIVGTLRSGENVYLETERVVNAGKGVPVTWQKITSFSGYRGWVNANYVSTMQHQ